MNTKTKNGEEDRKLSINTIEPGLLTRHTGKLLYQITLSFETVTGQYIMNPALRDILADDIQRS
jgi:hypothetical protein